MLNGECSMLNEKGPRCAASFNIEHSTLNIQHLLDRAASRRETFLPYHPIMLEKYLDDGILTIRLAHGKASALDLELCNALASAFEEAAADDDVGSVILTGTGSIFCAGVD